MKRTPWDVLSESVKASELSERGLSPKRVAIEMGLSAARVCELLKMADWILGRGTHGSSTGPVTKDC